MRILVTGATGFVGSAIVRELLRLGHSVRALARPSSMEKLPSSDHLQPISGDVTSSNRLESAMDGVDGVFHCAAVYSYWHRDPAETYRVNVDGTVNVLEYIRYPYLS